MLVSISEIKISAGRREADPDGVQKLMDSVSKVGLLNPITIDQKHTLIAGLHRLEAVKLLGWTEIECTVSSLEGLLAELAEVDENVVRKGLSAVEYSDLLLRRKEIYESLHPETKATYEGGAFRGNQHQNVVGENFSATSKSFVQDTADKLGVSPRTVELQIQTAKNLTPEAKAIIKDAKVTKSDALKLSRLAPEQQTEVASQLVTGDIHSVDEYQPPLAGPKPTEPEPSVPPEVPESDPGPAGRCPSIQELAADLKNPDKDRRCTPDKFLVTFSYFLQRFCQSMENYTGPEYDAVLPILTQQHLEQIYQKVQFVHEALDEMYRKMERMAQSEAT